MQLLQARSEALVQTPTKARSDIQALRAIAVVIVLLYHFWPKRLSGGFVGVDVFFVISGFLITSHLVARAPHSLRDVTSFWARRIRRLLPLSFLVLTATLLGTIAFAALPLWKQTFSEVVASTLYVENWYLAGESVDYLASENVASPVQHFWSLSVEEQFYLVWPLLAISASLLASTNPKKFSRYFGLIVLAVVVVSFVIANLQVGNSNPSAYFSTATRAWELGIGALVAIVLSVWPQRSYPAWIRNLVTWVGLGAIAAAAVFFDKETPFPGGWALLPTLGVVLVILGDAALGHPLSPLKIGALKPVQYVGDISYGIYLWHWPILILAPYALGGTLHATEKIACIVLTFALAAFTKRVVEDRFRTSTSFGGTTIGAFVFMLVGALIISAAALTGIRYVEYRTSQAETELKSRLESGVDCFGAAALSDRDCDPHGEELFTAPELAKEDKPAPYADKCWVLGDFSSRKVCHYGASNEDADARIALLGNSHAGHWLPALQEIGAEMNLSIDTYLISECYTVLREIEFEDETQNINCQKFNEFAISEVTSGNYDAVVMSNRTWRPIAGVPSDQQYHAQRAAYDETLQRFSETGTPLLVIRDTPFAYDLKNVPDCVAANEEAVESCDGDTDRLVVDPLADAVDSQTTGNTVQVADFTDRFCNGSTCYSVVGGVIVYFDLGHMTQTYSKSLAPELVPYVVRLLEE